MSEAQKEARAKAPTSLQRLISAPKGAHDFTPAESFMLHVFWLTPSESSARDLLSSLQRCAAATRRDTPCVPTYFFRVSSIDSDLCPPPPSIASEHPHIRKALSKLQVGVPLPAVRADLHRHGIDDLDVSAIEPSSELPERFRQRPVFVECTELYLDERAFNEHAGSRDYLDAYGQVMNPALMFSQSTVRVGTPTGFLVDRVLGPMLNEIALTAADGSVLWKTPSCAVECAVMLSLDVPSHGQGVSAALCQCCTTCVMFDHPLRRGERRLLCVVPRIPTVETLCSIAALSPIRGEAFVVGDARSDTLRQLLSSASLGFVTVNTTEFVGTILHADAPLLNPKQ